MTAPTIRSLVVERHARVGVVGDIETATEAWLILHGYGMLAQGILHWFRAAARPGRVLVAPEALSRFYSETRGVRRVGASWMTREAREDDLLDIMTYLDRVATEVIGDVSRLEIHGFSQGVAAGARWTVRQTRPVARLVCWGGKIPEDVAPALLRSAIAEGAVHYAVGSRDVWTPAEAIGADAARLEAAGLPVRLHPFDGGHRVDDGVLAALDGEG